MTKLAGRARCNPQFTLGVVIGLGIPYDRIGTNYIIADEGADRVIEHLRGYKPLRAGRRAGRKTETA